MNNDHLKNIVKLFESCRYKYDIYNLFSDWCACAAISLSNSVDIQQREKREARYMEIIGQYNRDVVDTFPKIFGEVIMALETGPQDILGAVFHELEIHNKDRGQFFTPYALCRLMANINIGGREDLQRIIDTKGYITAHEPAVGAGATIIALADEIHRVGINYQKFLHVTAVDVDQRAVHMAYIQFSLMHIPAHIIVGDTLRMEFREDWFTPAHIMGGWSRKLRREDTSQESETVDNEMPEPDQKTNDNSLAGLPLFDITI